MSVGKHYETTVWSEPDGLRCSLCGHPSKHGIGIEGKVLDVDICDDCAGTTLAEAMARKARPTLAEEMGRKARL